MTLCPIALTAGCNKCPAFKVCPLPCHNVDAQEPWSDPDTSEDERAMAEFDKLVEQKKMESEEKAKMVTAENPTEENSKVDTDLSVCSRCRGFQRWA